MKPKLKLVIPGWPRTSIWKNLVFRFPYLSVTTLAAITPDSWDIKIEDENVAPVNFDDGSDLVGITALTPLAPRAYEISRQFRARGAKTVMGGFHASANPEEAALHVDSVAIGEAEAIWPAILEDFGANRLKPMYRAERALGFPPLPPARRDLLNRKKYLFLNTMQTTRGCPFDCEFCSVTAYYGRSYRTRPLEDVARELQTLAGMNDFLFVVDDNIVGNPGYAKKVFEVLGRHKFKWLSQASITFARDPELLKLARDSGCQGMFIGFESLEQEALEQLNKNWGRAEDYATAIQKIHDNGIGIQGSFIFGYDWDTKATFDRVLEFTQKMKLESVLFTILTPFPGTKVYERLDSQKRILTRDWSRYDMAHAVFQPKNMSPGELEESYVKANREFHSWGSIFRRLPWKSRRIAVFGPMNWGFRRGWQSFDVRA